MTETDLTLATLEGSRPGSYQIVTLGPILSLYFYAILYAISMIYLDYIPVQFRLLGIVAAFLISGSLIVGIVPRVRVSVANKPDRRPNRPIRIAGWIFLAIGIVILVTLLFVLPQSLACILA